MTSAIIAATAAKTEKALAFELALAAIGIGIAAYARRKR